MRRMARAATWGMQYPMGEHKLAASTGPQPAAILDSLCCTVLRTAVVGAHERLGLGLDAPLKWHLRRAMAATGVAQYRMCDPGSCRASLLLLQPRTSCHLYSRQCAQPALITLHVYVPSHHPRVADIAHIGPSIHCVARGAPPALQIVVDEVLQVCEMVHAKGQSEGQAAAAAARGRRYALGRAAL